ncbi:MAG: hypothetical protein QXJ68_07850 [Methanocellales archaeon]
MDKDFKDNMKLIEEELMRDIYKNSPRIAKGMDFSSVFSSREYRLTMTKKIDVISDPCFRCVELTLRNKVKQKQLGYQIKLASEKRDERGKIFEYTLSVTID